MGYTRMSQKGSSKYFFLRYDYMSGLFTDKGVMIESVGGMCLCWRVEGLLFDETQEHELESEEM